ncbi:hypothetical protein AB0P12_24595 [Streptomyces subrutilus]|uniref:Uncharacterized protein n=1 Tax=Streptomyces subrutilus TaxID=36818 RepID=A0A5P2UQ49_9ACTN|nr:hypothetical protein [Streptomyces subrutilus]QEU79644.1 hypothetical protein CP968_16065 [Streptomyces subrutilus]WSJ31108.1 hypothetical protein OG479_18515 [Streptomyces subrutilus]GGZ84578.1 hypothetical protein GCM10010371_50480 [Streptomyces subrutilus]
MSQGPKTAATNLNVLLPVAYALAVVVTATLASGKVTTVVAVGGGVLLGLWFAFGRRAARG